MPSYIFYWVINHIVLFVCLAYRIRKQMINFEKGNIFFILYKVSVTSGLLLLLYWIGKVVGGWHLDSWPIEATWAGLTFAVCDLVFIGMKPVDIAPRQKNFFTGNYKKLRTLYIMLRITFFIALYLRLILMLLSVLSFNPRSGAAYYPDKRGKDLNIFGHYYLDYSARKGVVVVKKYGLFEKDVSVFRRQRSFENGVPETAVSGDCKATVILYPSVLQKGDTMVVQSDPGRYNYIKEYMLIRVDKARQTIVIDLYNNHTTQRQDSMLIKMK